MSFWTILAVGAIFFTAIQLLPQVYKSLKTKTVRDLSLGLCIIVSFGAVCWLIYGIHIKDWPIITANIINLIAALILLYLKIKK